MHNPEKNSPQKITLEKLRAGLSRKQENRIAYECDLLRTSSEKLFYMAPFLFQEDVTAANTIVIKEKEEITQQEPKYSTDTNDDEDYYYNLYDHDDMG